MLTNVCENAGFLLRISVKVLKVLQIAIPILLIILICFDLFKTFTSQLDEKTKSEAIGKAAKRFIYAIIVFLIPTIITLIFTTINSLTTKDDNLASSVSWLDCWVELYTGKKSSRTYGGTLFTPAPTSYVIATPTPEPLPPAIIKAYAFHTEDLDKESPNYQSHKGWDDVEYQALVWGGGDTFQAGFCIKPYDDKNANRIAFAASENINEINNLSYDDYDPWCSSFDGTGWYFGQLKPSANKCIKPIANFSNSRDAKNNYGIQFPEFKKMRDDRDVNYYVSFRLVNDKDQMSAPIIFRIKMKKGANEAAAHVEVCKDTQTCSDTLRVYGN